MIYPISSRVSIAPEYRLKRFFDVVLACMALLLLSPLLLFIAILVRVTSGGPIIYSQVRTGVNRRRNQTCQSENQLKIIEKRELKDRQNNQYGKPFRIFKFRSMVINAEFNGQAVWAKAHDPRVTLVGNFLRRTHLDELPQLVNILKGDMSFVGPRPERPVIIQDLREKITNYEYRLMVRPGVTGLAQVMRPADIALNDVRKKVRLDLLHMKKQSLLMDIKLIVGTIPMSIGIPANKWRRIRFTNPIIGGIGRVIRIQKSKKRLAPRSTRFLGPQKRLAGEPSTHDSNSGGSQADKKR